MDQLGRLTHYAFDAILVSAFLAGIKRSTGLTYAQPQSSFSKPESVALHALPFTENLHANNTPIVGPLAPESIKTRYPRAKS
ncbi:hypothetical protein MMC28_005645 [Mycoblastus sanguinarius]|nr:hypothetical protein [Mycoblastus sanguinarius]